MTRPSGLRIERPYASLEAYLAGDAWTVDRSEMVLVGATDAGIGEAVTFEIVLSDGARVVSGEARVVAEVNAEGDRPAGLRVRFRKLDAASKNVLRRALEARGRRAPKDAQDAPSAVANDVPVSAVANDVHGGATASDEQREMMPSKTREPSGVRHRPVGVIQAPNNRDELLSRLRFRQSR